MSTQARGGGRGPRELGRTLAAALFGLGLLVAVGVCVAEVVHGVRLLLVGERTTGRVMQCTSYGKGAPRCRLLVAGASESVWLRGGVVFPRMPDEGAEAELWWLPPDPDSARLARFPLEEGLVVVTSVGALALALGWTLTRRAQTRSRAAASR